MDNIVESAYLLAVKAHEGQVDKLGKAYITHPEAVAMILTISPAFHNLNSEEKIFALAAAYLHDVVEDTGYTVEDLTLMGFPETVVNAVELLTFKPKLYTRSEYYEMLLTSPVARSVKVADLVHNNTHHRVIHLPEDQQERLAVKYGKAKEALLQEDEVDFFYRATAIS